MSPECVIQISKENYHLIDYLVAEGKIKILSKRLTPEENRTQAGVLWNKQAPRTRELISEFKKEHALETEEKIVTGVLSLIADVFGKRYEAEDLRIVDAIEVPTLKKALVSFFESSVPLDLPDDVIFLPSTRKPALARQSYKYGTNYILPLYTAVLIERYGLTDGILKPIASVCVKNGLSPSLYDRIMLGCPIMSDPQIRTLILK